MKKRFTFIFLVLLLSILSVNSFASKYYPPDTLSYNSNWYSDTIIVNHNIYVHSGVNLNIYPGTIVIFNGNYSIFVDGGAVQAIGNVNDTIYFKPSNTTSGWAGIQIQYQSTSADSVIFDYCVFEYSKRVPAQYDLGGGALAIKYCDRTRVTNSRFSYNESSGPLAYGAAVTLNYMEGSGRMIQVNNNVFDHNYSPNRNGAVSVYKAALDFKNNVVRNNEGGVTVAGFIYYGGSIVNNFFANNKCNTQGAVYFYGSKANYEVDFINNIVANNDGSTAGGLHIFSSRPNIINNTIVNNLSTDSTYGGGVLFEGNSDAIFRNNIIYGNENIYEDTIQIYIANPLSDPNFYNNDIQKGLNGIWGAGANANYSGVYSNNMDVNPLFSAPTYGVGYAIPSAPSNWNIAQGSPVINKGFKMSSNPDFPSTDFGGSTRIFNGKIDMGAYENQDDLVADCYIHQNTHWIADTININCNIYITFNTKLTIEAGTYVKFNGAYKIFSNGIIQALGTPDNRIVFSVDDTTGFYDTTSTSGSWLGIEIFNPGSNMDSVLFKYCDFTYAKAIGVDYSENCGGALYVFNSPKLKIENCLFSNNMANFYGGAVHIENSEFTFNGNIVANNTSLNSSGGINLSDCVAAFNNNNVVNNHSNGVAGMYLARTEIIMRNSIFYGNTSTYFSSSPIQLRYYASSYSKIYNSVIEHGASNIIYNVPLTTIQNVYDTLPLFVNPSAASGMMYDGLNADWRIQTNSPLVNLGSSASVSYSKDFNGKSRWVSTSIDIGAHEVQIAKRFIDLQPLTTHVCLGSQAQLSAHISVNADYQWQKNGLDIPNAISQNLFINNANYSDTAYYNCIFTNDGISISSDTVKLNILNAPSVLSQPSNVVSCLGDSATFSTLIQGSEPINYQWYNINGALASGTYPTYKIISTSLNDASTYYLEASNICGSVSTNTVTLTVNTAPYLSVLPASNTVCESSSITLTTAAVGTYPISYQWYKGNTAIPSANSLSYSISTVNLNDDGVYYCEATNVCGSSQTNQSILNVDALPAILVQPLSDSLCTGQSHSLNVIANGATPLSYQWYKGSNAIGSANYNTLNFSNINSSHAANYYCQVSNSCGSVNSNVINLTVNQPISLGFQSGDSSKCEGEFTSFAVNAIGTTPITYQWYKGSNAISGAQSPTYTLNSVNLADDDFYYVEVSNMCNSVLSTYKNLTVHPNPVIHLGNDTSFCLGGQLSLSPGFGYNCIWSNGALNNQITVNSSGSYFVNVVDQNGCSATSDTINVNVLLPYPNQEICIVGIDSATNKNIVVWEKPTSNDISSFNVYKESSVSNVWTLIGNVDYDSLSTFIDVSSTPNTKPERYSISVLDSCGNESALSPAHRTMHLTVNAGQTANTWNLLWNAYEGFQPSTYRIYRADSSLQFVKIDSIAGSSSYTYLWTDNNAPSGLVYYLIEIAHPQGNCGPTKANTNYNTSRSNHANNGIIPNLALSPDFTATPISGIAPLNVQFVDKTSNGSVDDYYWNFGDGNFSTLANPSHTYANPGIYHVSLSVSNQYGSQFNLKTAFINVLANGMVSTSNPFELNIFPNPYTSQTNIKYSLANNARVKIEIYSSLGELVAVLVDNYQLSGSHTYSFSARDYGFSSGVYLLKMQLNEQIITKKLVEVK